MLGKKGLNVGQGVRVEYDRNEWWRLVRGGRLKRSPKDEPLIST